MSLQHSAGAESVEFTTQFPNRLQLSGRRLIVLALIGLAVMCLFSFPHARVAYHRWQWNRGRDYLEGIDRWGEGNFLWHKPLDEVNHLDHHDYHLDRLVQLGSVKYRKYRLNNIDVPSDEASHLFQSLYSLPSLSCSSPWPDSPQPMVLEVWTEWTDIDAWDSFIAEHDVPNYRERFMDGDE